MEVDWGLVIVFVIVTCLSSTGLFSFIQFLLNRKSSIKKDICDLKIAVSRVQLVNMMQHDPENKDAILKEAENYFIKLGGDGYMANVFYDWACQNNVDISWYKRQIQKNERSN